jgi:hypothetical protein
MTHEEMVKRHEEWCESETEPNSPIYREDCQGVDCEACFKAYRQGREDYKKELEGRLS